MPPRTLLLHQLNGYTWELVDTIPDPGSDIVSYDVTTLNTYPIQALPGSVTRPPASSRACQASTSRPHELQAVGLQAVAHRAPATRTSLWPINIDLSSGNTFELILDTEDVGVDLAFSYPVYGKPQGSSLMNAQVITLAVIQTAATGEGGGGELERLHVEPDGEPPSLSNDASKRDIFQFYS